MKMPKVIENKYFSPCGMNCMICYAHLKEKNPCPGCLVSDINKPERCKECKIKMCANNKDVKYCFECKIFPCVQIKKLEKSYNKRYKTSLIENSKLVKKIGIKGFQNKEKEKWLCTKCSGVIIIHDGICSECKVVKYSIN